MYFRDLSYYSYDTPTGLVLPSVLNVGWLANGHDFPKGEPQSGVVNALINLLVSGRTQVARGIHECPFCGNDEIVVPREGDFFLLGHSEIWFPGRGEVVYASPSLIIHYITAHGYCPPQEFQDAALSWEPTASWDGDAVRDSLIRNAPR